MTKTPEEKREYQRQYRLKNKNRCTKKYEKTHKGFLVRLYRNMLSRISGVQKVKHYLYEGKELLPKEEFYSWTLSSTSFYTLWDEYEKQGFPQKLAPSVDRKDSSLGYSSDNMEWVTHSENSRRGAVQRHKKNSSYS